MGRPSAVQRRAIIVKSATLFVMRSATRARRGRGALHPPRPAIRARRRRRHRGLAVEVGRRSRWRSDGRGRASRQARCSAFPAFSLVVLDTAGDCCVLVDLGGKVAVVLEGGASRAGCETEIVGGLVDVAIAGPNRRHHLVDVEPRPDDQGLAAAGRSLMEPNERVTLDTDGLTQQAVGERVASLGAARGRLVEELDRPVLTSGTTAGSRKAPACDPLYRTRMRIWPAPQRGVDSSRSSTAECRPRFIAREVRLGAPPRLSTPG